MANRPLIAHVPKAAALPKSVDPGSCSVQVKGNIQKLPIHQAEAESLVRDFEESGMHRKAFCTARGVALHTLDYYRARYRTRRAATAAQGLLPVDLIGAPLVSGGLRVELANGRRIVVEVGFDVSVQKQLVAALEGREDDTYAGAHLPQVGSVRPVDHRGDGR